MNHIELLKVLFTGLRSPPVVGGPGGCFWGDHRSKGIGGAVGGCCSKGELQEGCYADRSNVQREDDATPSNPAEVVSNPLCGNGSNGGGERRGRWR